ncbi:NB-ARC domain-containing protein [Actinophytocola sp.]|uniref:NB-ARC domain-containing protein n=1 Tax=Actinophytocola sp. TaxID=1872138 RepID=UPI002D7FB07B|nr:NB-ARC domain-containing protein [Actinophytocola sp.]HET9137735.1 NB-ARC domain-containing protein [Actinophytocola sp.]
MALAFVRACQGDLAVWEQRWHDVAGPRQTRPVPRPAAGVATPLPRPAQLPLRPRGSPGRAAELRQLNGGLVERGAPVLISGPVGVGKSELALRHAHAIADQQVDGQLYADLGSPDLAEQGADTVLSGFLQALGVAGEHLPNSPDQRAGLYRSLLAERRLVVLLDNVPNESTARTLLAPAPRTVTIMVSRRRLLGLRDVRRVQLDVLSRADSIAMISAAVDVDDRDRVACDRLAALCGDLPLALDVATRKLAARPNLDLGGAVSRLAEPGVLPRWLRIGDISVQQALNSVYQRLSGRATSLLGYLARHAPCEHIVLNAVGDADEPIEELVEAGMLRRGLNSGSFRLDALIRAFAIQRTAPAPSAGGPRVLAAPPVGPAQRPSNRATRRRVRRVKGC